MKNDRDVGFLQIPVGELEISNPDDAPVPNEHGQISLLVKIHGIPLGTFSLLEPGSTGAPVNVSTQVLTVYTEEIRAHLLGDGQPGHDLFAEARETMWACANQPIASTDLISVIVCTLGQDERLRNTVQSVLNQAHSHLELVVVENKPGRGHVRKMLADVTDPRLRIVTEPRRGLSVARNTGLAAAGADIIAFTDDDAFADPQWLRHLIRPFDEHENVVCVTGLVLAAELATPAQVWFEEFGGFDKGFERVVWRTGDDERMAGMGTRGQGGPLFPYSAGVYGSGNNMAFRTDWLRAHDGFDVALGAGSFTRGGEDLDAFLAVMLGGATIIYEPHALVWHHARTDMAALSEQMYGYGSGMSAVITKHFVTNPRGATGILRRLPAGIRRLLDPRSGKNEKKSADFPPGLRWSELSGYLAGPALYVRGRRDARRRKLRAPADGIPR